MTHRVPAEVFPPGEYIRDEIDARGWTQEDLATILNRPAKAINEILSGKKSITPDTAHGLGAAFGTDPQFWMNLESAYRLSLAAHENFDVAKRAEIYGLAPVKEMMKRNWIKPTSDLRELESELLEFFDLSAIEEEPKLRAVARKSTTYAETTPAQRAWFFRVKRLAETIPVATFRKENLSRLFADLRSLMTSEQEVRHVPRLLSEFGIRFVVVEHLPKTRIDGATIWLDDGSPVLAVSIRYDRIDWFWHTLAHELVHILNEDESGFDDEIVGGDSLGDDEKPELEIATDTMACNLLVPTPEIESFIARVHPLYSRTRINQFANRIQIHPGIIVGQLQKRKMLGWNQGRELLVKIRDHVTSTAMTDGWGHYPIQG
jgi:HTH-type transcriptional regulator/antitoxin HigA